MPLEAQALQQALPERLKGGSGKLHIHQTLCRREASAFQAAIKASDDVIVACTQEAPLFTELAEQTEGAKAGVAAPIRFVNIRETGGWSGDAKALPPKLAALLAAAAQPQAEPVAQVSYNSAGQVLVIGALGDAQAAAALLGDELQATVLLATSAGGAMVQNGPRSTPVLGGGIQSLRGYLGAFKLQLRTSNPINLDLCTGCGACVAACPERAIGADFQVNLSACKSHRTCVAACGEARAIDFAREPVDTEHSFDLVLDLRSEPAFTQHAKPQGYFHVPLGALQPSVPASTALALSRLVGEFQKPKFFTYKQKLCAHSRNEKTGCNACVEVCSAKAISSEAGRQQIKVNPNLCVGCGACTTVCPTGALGFQYPTAAHNGQRVKAALQAYAHAGGQGAHLLLHSEGAGQQLINAWGQAALHSRNKRPGVQRVLGPAANLLPLAVWHTASLGLDLWLAAVCYGASQVTVLASNEEAPQYLAALRQQMGVAQALLEGLGFCVAGEKVFQVVQENATDLVALDEVNTATEGQKHIRNLVSKLPAATFALAESKRDSLERILDHLLTHAPALQSAKAESIAEPIALPAASPWGTIQINKDRCTMCLSCINACPASALSDGQALPQLHFTEKNCVQCGLCAQTCPENAIQLVPRLLTSPERKQPRVLNEMQPYRCVRCQKPFGTLKAIEAMVGKLAGHSMFQGAAAERLKMCMDCRVIDLYSADNEATITKLP